MPFSEQRLLENLTGPEVGERLGEGSVVVWPMGAVEQHGPHLPLSVDYVIAEETARAAVEACGEELDIWLLPTLAVTKSNEHAWSPGTLWLSAETMLAVVDDVARSVAATSAKRLVFLNAHGGNSALLGMACREVRLKHGLMTFLVHPFVPPDQGGASGEHELAMGIHGGHDETSLMLHLRPELVQMDKATRRIPEHLAGNEACEIRRFCGIRLAVKRLRPRRAHRRPNPRHSRRRRKAVCSRGGEACGAIARNRCFQLLTPAKILPMPGSFRR